MVYALTTKNQPKSLLYQPVEKNCHADRRPRTDGQTDRQTNGQTDKRTDRRTTYRLVHSCEVSSLLCICLLLTRVHYIQSEICPYLKCMDQVEVEEATSVVAVVAVAAVVMVDEVMVEDEDEEEEIASSR
jgi:hypothetical protein